MRMTPIEDLDIRDHLTPTAVNAMAADIRRAAALSVVCDLWLKYWGDDVEAARESEPLWDLPASFSFSKEFNQARKATNAWDPYGPGVHWPTVSVTKTGKIRKVAGRTANPRASWRWDWTWVFDYWHTGGLDRNIEDMLALLPERDASKLREEL